MITLICLLLAAPASAGPTLHDRGERPRVIDTKSWNESEPRIPVNEGRTPASMDCRQTDDCPGRRDDADKTLPEQDRPEDYQ